MKGIYEFDPLERRIVQLLQKDASLSHADLAEKVGSSSASCWRRIRALEAAGVLSSTVRLVSPERIGRGVNVICNIRVRSHSREVRGPFEEFVRSRPEIMECYSMSGEWDYLLRILVKDVASYEDFLMHRLLNHAAVATASSHFALSTVKYTTAVPL